MSLIDNMAKFAANKKASKEMGSYGERFHKLQVAYDKGCTVDKDEDLIAASHRFIGTILDLDMEISSPGPYSPKRWILFTVHNHIYPQSKQCDDLYRIGQPTQDYLESLEALVEVFKRRGDLWTEQSESED